MKTFSLYENSVPLDLKNEKMSQQPFSKKELSASLAVHDLVNAVHYLHGPLGDKEAKRLLFYITHLFYNFEDENKGKANRSNIDAIVDVLCTIYYSPYKLNFSIPFYSYIGINCYLEFLHKIKMFLKNNHGIILLATDYKWGLVKGLRDIDLLLFSSEYPSYLSRENCTSFEEDSSNKVLLHPSKTLFLWTD